MPWMQYSSCGLSPNPAIYANTVLYLCFWLQSSFFAYLKLSSPLLKLQRIALKV